MRMIWQVFSLSDGHRGNSEKSSETGENLFSHRKPQSREREICKITNNRDNQNGNHQHENRDQIENRNNKFWLQNNLKFAGLYFLIEKFKQMKWKNKENCKSKKQNKKSNKLTFKWSGTLFLCGEVDAGLDFGIQDIIIRWSVCERY